MPLHPIRRAPPVRRARCGERFIIPVLQPHPARGRRYVPRVDREACAPDVRDADYRIGGAFMALPTRARRSPNQPSS